MRLLPPAAQAEMEEWLIPLEGVYLVADQVFHDKCWDKYLAIGTYQEAQTGRSAVPPCRERSADAKA